MKTISSILIITICAAFLFSCGRTIDEDNFVTVAEGLKSERFYKGDSSLSISFVLFQDTAGRIFKTNCEKEGIVETFEKDSFFIVNCYKILGSGEYNGACEARKDTLFVYYWVDSIGCVGGQSSCIMHYKIRKGAYNHIQVEYLDNRNAPFQKWCEEDLKKIPQPKFYKGDSTVTLSFVVGYKSKEMFKKHPPQERKELIEVFKKGKTLVIDVYKNLTGSDYNGAAELVEGKLYLYCWMDSVGCIPALAPYKFTYTIEKLDYKEIQFKYLYRKEVPSMRREPCN